MDPSPGTGVASYEIARNGIPIGTSTTTSYTASNLTANTAYTFAVLAVDGAGNRSVYGQALAVTTSADALTFTGQNIGSTGAPGSYSSSGGSYTVSGAGTSIWGSNDRFYFAHRPMTGDGTFTVRVVSQTNTAPWAKAGIMIREDLTTGARNAAMLITPSNGEVFQYRPTAVTRSYSIGSGDASRVAPIWLRLVRSGNTLTGYQSSDGTSWTVVSSYTFNGLLSDVYVGFAVSSTLSGVLSTVVYDSVVLSGGTTP
jgi:regulation of enolase protein 1 (concanavalin A-like superfamily)